MFNELNKFRDSLKKQMEEFDKFKKIRGTEIFRMAVDDRGANKVEHCVQLPRLQGRKKKNIKKVLEDLNSCFENVRNEIKSRPHTDYKKTLYIEAINRAIEDLQSSDTEGGRITIFGDLAIMDDECSWEEKKCSCKSYKKLNNLKSKILRHKKKDKYFSIDIRQINIPAEESVVEKKGKRYGIFS